jgi:uncharacterized protein YcfJ
MAYISKLILAACASLLCAPAPAQATRDPVKQVALKTGAPEYRRSADERVYEAAIISVRAVMGRPEHRCWVEGASAVHKADAAVEIIGRDPESTQLISRCQSVQSGSPDYWDVTYRFRNVEHTVQMSAAPGQVMYVNKRGEPRL